MKGIYKITNKVNNNFYIGSSIDIERRWHQHRSILRRGISHNYILQRAWSKYGEESFIFEVIKICDDLEQFEQYYIDKLNPKYNVARDVIYNPMVGATHTKEARKKMGESRRGERNPNNKITKDDVLKIRKLYANTGITQTEIGNMFGISQGQVGKIVRNEHWSTV